MFEKIKRAFKNFGKKTDAFVFKHAKESIFVVQDLKRFFEMPFFDGVVQVTPNKIDNVALPIIRKTLDEVVIAMTKANSCSHLPTQDERLKCFIAAMREEHKEDLNRLYLEIAAWYFKKRQLQNNINFGFNSSKIEVQNVYSDLKSKGLV